MDKLIKKLKISVDYYNNLSNNKDDPFVYIIFLKGMEYAFKLMLDDVELKVKH